MAPSGTGKSTHARLWREVYGDRVTMINDDKPLIRAKKDGEIRIFGSPWNGKHHLGQNVSAPLNAIVRMRRGERNSIQPLDKTEALKLLYLGTERFDDPEKTGKLLEIIDRIMRHVRFYDLQCNMDPEAARVAFRSLIGEE